MTVRRGLSYVLSRHHEREECYFLIVFSDVSFHSDAAKTVFVGLKPDPLTDTHSLSIHLFGTNFKTIELIRRG